MWQGAKNVWHGVEKVRHCAKNVRHGVRNVRHGAKNVRHGAKNAMIMITDSMGFLKSVPLVIIKGIHSFKLPSISGIIISIEKL